MAANRVMTDYDRLEKRNYIRKPGRDGRSYIAFFEKSVVHQYNAKSGGNFNLIIVGDQMKEDDFYLLPYAQIKTMLTSQTIHTDKDGRERWNLTIRNHKLTVGPSGNRLTLPVGAFYGTEVQLETEAEDDAEVIQALERVQARGQGLLLDSTVRQALEQHAMDAARKHFEDRKYLVIDRSKTHPYDLECRKDGEVLYVEVKGTQTKGDQIILTQGEVKFAKSHKDQMALFVLHSIKVSKKGDRAMPSGGERRVLEPWDVDLTRLTPLSYAYEV